MISIAAFSNNVIVSLAECRMTPAYSGLPGQLLSKA